MKPLLDSFYQQVGYHSCWGEHERAFCLQADKQIKGSVKVESIHGVSILRGMYLANELHGQGYGSKLLRHIEPLLNQTISYCLPFSHLTDFYNQIRFYPINPQQLSEFLQVRFAEYQKDGYDIVAMKRDISGCHLNNIKGYYEN